MKKEQVIAAGAIVLLALGLVLFGRGGSAPVDAISRIQETLKAREVPVVVVTDGKSGVQGEFLGSVKQALAGLDRVRLIHVDKRNPAERQAMAQFPTKKLPMLVVFGLNGAPLLNAETVDAAAIKAAVAEGLTKPPVSTQEDDGHQH